MSDCKEKQRAKARKYKAKNRAKIRKYMKKWRKNNPLAMRKYYRKWMGENPDKMKEYYLKKAYGIDMKIYRAMLKEQDSKCAGCNADLSVLPRLQVNIDHCHTSGKIRGILCGNCNRTLGLMKDDPDRLRRLAAYADKFVGPG